ncbi:hypothetical protein [Bacillus cereus]|uniref:hypothetical protein n=1 Tax=Bacillus cereus TaxID=1396 RepID=UPI000BF53945|nr:hypothetical protein [Bacillus cereus]PET56974.1 hypothetical protein CN522_28380 [Bacillus cereus]PFB26326.1 hypothetical protein CN392_29850 [Bacillus cereus]PFL81566.1 hypothetical protein COJ32_06420 [Bacillus cereus]PGV04148.1 hypothetical protein COD81_23975 [Bacillus cereus]
MLKFEMYKSNKFEMKVKDGGHKDLILLLKKTLFEEGYNLILDKAKDSYLESLGLEDLPLESETLRSSAMSELLYLKRMDRSTYSWCDYSKLKSFPGYVIINLINIYEKSMRYVISEFDSAPSMSYRIELKFILPLGENEEATEINDLLAHLTSIVEEVNGFEIEKKTNDKFQELVKKYEYANFNENDYIIAKEFYNKDFSSLLQRIRAAGGMFRKDINMKFQSIKNIDALIEKMIELNLLELEYVVLCKSSSQKINVMPNKEVFQFMGEKGVRCSHCNNLISDELLEEWFSVTELGNQMLNGSHWMTIILVDTLRKFHINDENILVNIQEGPEEIDAFVNFDGELLQFELKDKQFSMGHAYIFQSRLVSYSPSKGIIWSTDGVAPEVREHFDKVDAETDIYYIENMKDLESGLESILTGVRNDTIQTNLSSLIEETALFINIPKGIINNIEKWDDNKKGNVEVEATQS